MLQEINIGSLVRIVDLDGNSSWDGTDYGFAVYLGVETCVDLAGIKRDYAKLLLTNGSVELYDHFWSIKEVIYEGR
jgi:hypothetical protein